MKTRVEVTEVQEIDIDAIKVSVSVRYDEEDIPHDFPLRDREMWTGTIDADTGVIREWPKGKSGKMHMKVCDEGVYTLLCRNRKDVVRENEYVPPCIPGSHGDYIEFDIGEDGRVAKWEEFFTARNVAESFFDYDL